MFPTFPNFAKPSWLVVFTILKNMSQWEGLSHIFWTIQFMFETTNQYVMPTSHGKSIYFLGGPTSHDG